MKVTIKGKPVSRHENNSPTRVPHFLQLAQVGTKFSTHLQGDKRNNTLSTTPLPGDEENNRLWHQHGKDTLKGKGGQTGIISRLAPVMSRLITKIMAAKTADTSPKMSCYCRGRSKTCG
ncbi:hypothetical protein CCS41_02070 [Candidatus Fukatsuia symbiotica]|uniref:Uncharacterized protein n=1 Tax=Candidatus Fukatsuia symbiotica TaxID=1878942 RepID=A0A2U8I5R6_9GAMM|nr:hypothetical protein [Candidatus Fukatsuia symbiotica]AWK13565.1 hypothetical protein CCS41_02070 [Candidatus Fukatsuia symbiotica]